MVVEGNEDDLVVGNSEEGIRVTQVSSEEVGEVVPSEDDWVDDEVNKVVSSFKMSSILRLRVGSTRT